MGTIVGIVALVLLVRVGIYSWVWARTGRRPPLWKIWTIGKRG